MKTVIGLFDNISEAQQAVNRLESVGISRDNISLITNNQSGQYVQSADATEHHAPDAGSETAKGAVAGGIVGLLVGLAPFVIPGLGAIAAVGWLAATLTGAAIGAGVGLVGALMGIGVPEEEATYYSEGVRRGGTLVAVRAEDMQAEEAARILSDAGAVDIDSRAAQYREEGLTTPTATSRQTMNTAPANQTTAQSYAGVNTQAGLNKEGETVLPVVEENLQVGKRQVQRGGARIHTYMTEQPVQEQVTLREEHVNVERRPADRPVTEGDLAAFQEGTIEVTETAEVPVVAKEARVVEEVVIGKEATERTQTVQDTVRRTDVDVEQLPATSMAGTSHSFDTYSQDFRNNWQTTYANQGGRYEDYEPAYRYGYELGNSSQYRGRRWEDMESDIQRDWSQRYPNNTWDRFKNSVQYAWSRATGDQTPGIQTGGRAVDGTRDTRGITEKAADAMTGDRIDDKTGKVVR